MNNTLQSNTHCIQYTQYVYVIIIKY